MAGDRGLYGSSDPTFNGVLRQSYALLGLRAIGRSTPADALAWLAGQQCTSGAFQAYVAPGSACTAPDAQAYSGPDTNSTAVAAMALQAAGRAARAAGASRWLLRQQERNGGWAWIEGLAADPVSTGLVLQALRSGALPADRTRTAIARGERFLAQRIVGCPAGRDTRGGVGFTASSDPDPFSSVTALLGLASSLPVDPTRQRAAAPTLDCGETAPPAGALARYTIHAITEGRGVIESTFSPGSPDLNSTALGILGLVGSGYGAKATEQALGAIGRKVDAYVGRGTDASPAALGTLLLVAHATGASATSFGASETNLVKRLAATKRR